MKKIMFNDRYGLTHDVLSGLKTMTRRLVPKGFFSTEHDIEDNNTLVFEDMFGDWHDIRESRFAFKVGEVLAIAQPYRDIWQHTGYMTEQEAEQSAGYSNKMFVRADLMPHQIRITNVRVEKLQDISDEDCIKEGIRKWTKDYEIFKYDMSEGFEIFKWIDKPRTPRSAYAALIDKVSGKGTWESNPYVFAYEFELIK